MALPVEFVVAPGATGAALVAILAGVALGVASGLTPGIHANTFALGLAAVAPAVPGPPRLVGAAMLAAGTTHTFLDVVPALALGVPDPAMAASALPGHRLVMAGRGREALRLSAVGSGLALVLAVPLAWPVTAAMTALYPHLVAHLPLALGGVCLLLVVTERDWRGRVGAALALVASGGLGLATLHRDPAAVLPVGGMLAPLFAGLFGAPVLVESLDGGGVPPQGDAAIEMPRGRIGRVATLGTLSGAVVGYVPGVTAAIAAAGALGLLSDSGPRAFVVATSGVNTATAVFALIALFAIGEPRTGVLVALTTGSRPLAPALLVVAVAVAGGLAAVAVPVLGDRYLAVVGRIDYGRLALGVLCGLLALAYLFASWVGVAAFCAAALVGLVPAKVGARRASLMGVLLVPLAL